MVAIHICLTAIISEGMVLAMMATDVALLAAALIVVSLVELRVGGGDQFSIGSALRYERAARLARWLRVLVATSVLGFVTGIFTIWISGEIIKIATVVLGAAATIEFGIITLATLSLLLSQKADED